MKSVARKIINFLDDSKHWIAVTNIDEDSLTVAFKFKDFRGGMSRYMLRKIAEACTSFNLKLVWIEPYGKAVKVHLRKRGRCELWWI